MRNNLIFRYSSAIGSNLNRLVRELEIDSYDNLVSARSQFSGLSTTELEFLIEKLLEAQEQVEKITTKLQKELDNRK